MSTEAMKLALAALECKDGWGSSIRSQKERAITAIKQALEQPVQEPVARIVITHYRGALESWAFAERPSKAPAGVYDVYLGPPAAQRQWVGLTNEERLALEYTPQKVKRRPIQISFATEAKLKEKNT
jgi:hypothetical protein